MATAIIDVANYGALGYGNDTAIFQNTLLSVPLQGGIVVYSAPVYVPTGALTISQDRTHICGAGIYATEVMPGAGFSGPVFDFTNGENFLTQCSLKGFGFVGAGTNQKVAIRATDFSCFVLADIAIAQSWTGSGSIGLQLRGREALAARNLTIAADIPISIEGNPNSTIDADHFCFENTYLMPQISSNPSVLIAPNINLSNIIFTGYNAWVGGKYGLYWNDTGPPVETSLNLSFQNVRVEQLEDPTGHSFYINHYVQGVLFQNVQASREAAGFYLRNVKWSTLQNCLYYDDGTGRNGLDVDTSCPGLSLQNCFWQLGTTRSLGGLQEVWAIPQNASLQFPASAYYDVVP